MEIKMPNTKGDINNLPIEYDLGDCIFKSRLCELHSKNSEYYVHIEKKVSRVFQCLAQAHGDIVTRDEIFQFAWPKGNVSDDSLNRCISVLRQQLRNFNHGLSIKTHPKVGFNLVYPKEQAQDLTINDSTHFIDRRHKDNFSLFTKKHGVEPLDNNQTNNKPLDNFTWLSKIQSIKTIRFTLFISSILFLGLIMWLQFSYSQQSKKLPEIKINIVQQHTVIMPFILDDNLLKKYPLFESTFRQLLSNMPEHKLISFDEVSPLQAISPNSSEQYFNARFVIKTNGYQEKNRDILHWKIIDRLTDNEILDKQINLALNSNEINIRILAADIIDASSKQVFINNKEDHLAYIIKAANYLFFTDHKQYFSRPIINLLAHTITMTDPNSVEALITLAKFLTMAIWPLKQQTHPYLDLAINTLNKAILLDPYRFESYDALANIYLLKYQWSDALKILQQGKKQLATKGLSHQLTMYRLQKHTGHITGSVYEYYQKQFDDAPLINSNAIELASVSIQNNTPRNVITIANSLIIKNDEWIAAGATLGPSLIRYGNINEGKVLTIEGYKQLGVPESYADALVQGIIYPEFSAQASDFLTRSAEQGEFSEQLLLFLYAELGDIERYFTLAFKLANNYDFDIYSTMRANIPLIRQHPNFIPLMTKIGLVDYWQQYGLPDFCTKTTTLECH